MAGSILDRRIDIDKIATTIIGVGVAILPIHNNKLTELVTKDGEVGFFIPSFGLAIMFIGTVMYAYNNWRSLSWGDKRVYIPLLIIVVAIGISGLTADTLGGKVAPLFMGAALFILYMVSRKLGKDIFMPLAIGVGIASLGVMIASIINPGIITGGLLFEHNYDVVVGYVLLGMAVFIRRWQWVLASLSLIAMFLSGSPEAVFAVGVIVVMVLVRRDWGKRLLYAIIPVLLVVIVYTALGYTQQLYSYTGNVVKNNPTIPHPEIVKAKDDVENGVAQGDIISEVKATIPADEREMSAIEYRFAIIKEAMCNIKPLGTGYYLTDFRRDTVHNVPLIIVQQLGYPGIIAALAWLWVSVYCLVKTRWKYAWVILLALCVFDHYIWTQLAPVWWMLIGVSTASGIADDHVFKKPVLIKINEVMDRLNRMKEVYNNR